MKRKLLFSILSFVVSAVYSQIPDTVAIKNLLNEGSDLLNSSKHELSIQKYEEAKKLAAALNLDEYVYTAEDKIIQNLWRSYELEEATRRSHIILKIIVEDRGEEDIHAGRIYHELGTINLLDGFYDSAIFYLEKSIEIKKQLGESALENLSASYVNISNVYSQKGEIEKQLEYSLKSYEIDTKIYGRNHEYVAIDLSNIATVHMERGFYEESLDNLNEALDILRGLKSEGYTYTAVLSNLGRAYARMEEFDKGYDFQIQALRNNKKLFGESDIDHTSIYEALGKIFYDEALYDSSIFYYRKALEFEDQLKTFDVKNLSYMLRGIALAYLKIGDSDNAILHVNRAIDVTKETSGSVARIGILYTDLGILYLDLERYDEAEESFLTSLQLYDKIPNNSKVWRSASNSYLAEIYKRKKEYERSLDYIQKSLETHHENWKPENLFDNPVLEGVENRLGLMNTLTAKVDILDAWHSETEDSVVLTALIHTYKILSESMRLVRQSYSRLEDKTNFQDFYQKAFEGAIRTHLFAYRKFNDIKYLKDCFYYSEAAKSAILSEALSVIDAGKWADVPDDLLYRENEIKSNLAYYNTILKEEKANDSSSESLRIEFFEKKIFDLNRSLDSVVSILEKNYDDYYRVKYSHQAPQIDIIQDKLEADAGLLEFFMGDSLSYAFLITKDSFSVEELGQSSELVKLVDDFRTEFVGSISPDSVKENTTFISSSQALYTRVFSIFPELAEGNSIEKLIIIPGGALGYVPFDLLIENKEDEAGFDIKSQPYLLKRLDIRYAFSAGIEFLRTKKRSNRKDGVMTFAPVYDLTESQPVSDINSRFRSAIVPLKWNQEEAVKINDLMPGSNYLAEAATERVFKEKIGNHGVIHLAMHALIDDEEPMNSHLVFTQNNDSIEDGLLHAFELYNMNIDAELVVLSACETGYGKIVRGDGIMSLARGFAYAGVPSVVTSHWKVDDQSTSQLMTYFYEQLAEGHTKSKALRLAKLKFLENASPNKMHPFFWGSFIVLGDDSAILERSYTYQIVGVFALLFLGVWYYRKRKVN